MENKTITTREFLERIIADESQPADMGAKAKEMLAALNKRNEARAAKPTKTQKENEPVKADIVKLLSGCKGAVAADIATALSVSTQKASALCRQLVADKVLTVSEVKVKGKGAVKFYAIAAEGEGAEDAE